MKTMPFSPTQIRRQFPFFREGGRDLAYLDSAATAQKPDAVLDAMRDFYANDYANVHRGAYGLAARATERFESARDKIARFIGAQPNEIVFTKGTTEAVNLVANSWGEQNIKSGDEIVVSEMEHHANILPWQRLAERKGARLTVWPIEDDGALNLKRLKDLLTDRTRLIAVTHVSNVLGTINPIREICSIGHGAHAAVFVDGAQAVPKMAVDVGELGCDFYAFSGHKLYGPTGVGALFVKRPILETMPPWQVGGGTIFDVSWDKTLYCDPPYVFEAGTPPIAEAVGLGAAIDYLNEIGMAAIEETERETTEYALGALRQIAGLTLFGPDRRAGVFAFTLGDVHPHDIATILDGCGVAIRAGHHCAHPLAKRLGAPSTARASIGVYTDRDHIDALIKGLQRVREVFKLA